MEKMDKAVKGYGDFVRALLDAGFSMGSSNAEGIFALCAYSFDGTDAEQNARWHTGDQETDPWEWCMRVLNERDDVAYAKVFFKKSGYITKEWYPYFLAARRAGSFDEEYAGGTVSVYAKRIYGAVAENGALPLDEIKRAAGFCKGEKTVFERSLAELQMRMHLTMCGSRRKTSLKGGEYGWSSTVFCTTESFWGAEVFQKAAVLDKNEAVQKITERILTLNPDANRNKIDKFIKG